MKELIGAVVVIVGLWQGTNILKSIHRATREAALNRAAEGLPSLSRFNKKLHQGAEVSRSPAKE